MNPQKHIEEFLSRVSRKRKKTYIFRGLFLLLAFLTGTFLAGNLFSYFLPAARGFVIPILALSLIGLGAIVFYGFLRQGLLGFTSEKAARLTEIKYPNLNNSLINSCQLGVQLEQPASDREFSLPLIHEQFHRTHTLIQNIEPDSVIDSDGLNRHRNIFLGILVSLVLATLLIPDFLSQSFRHWTTPQASSPPTVASSETKKTPQASAPDFYIEGLSITFNYPAYTRMKGETVEPSDGTIEVLPGTEARITAKTNLPVSGGDMVWKEKDYFSMDIGGEKKLLAQFLVKEKGFYQFRVKDPAGEKYLLPKKYSVTPTRDQPPTILLFLANPKPTYYDNGKIQMFYEGQDDFGIQQIELVAYINGKTLRKNVKRMKSKEKKSQGDFAWNLAQANFEPGDEVQYFLEIKDNDNVSGPNIGQSEMYSFTIFDSRKEQENLILLQEELTEKLIALLGEGLVKNADFKKTPGDMMKGREMLISQADTLIDIIGMAQRIEEQAKTIDGFPQAFFNLFENIITGLTRIREEHIEQINKIQNSAQKTTPVGFTIHPIETLNEKLIAHLETDILFLVRMTNRQKMDQVMDLEKRLSELTESLREEFQKVKDKDAPLQKSELASKINKMRDMLNQMMDQLARQTQTLPDEFINPNAFKSLSREQFAASLDRIMQLMNQGKMDEALEELKKMADDLRTLADQLDQANSEMDNLVDMQIMQKLDDSLEKIENLEKQQKQLMDETTGINQSLRQMQSKKFEKEINDFFAALKKDVNSIQTILREDGEFLDNHPSMQRMENLLDQQAKLDRKIQDLDQKIVDINQNKELDKNFKMLNEARKELSSLSAEIDSLRTRIFQELKNVLPKFLKKYDTLEELTELYDLKEFNTLFKNTFPEVFQWQNNLRLSRNKREDLGERMNKDFREITRLNSEISKKLGSMMRMLRESDQTLLTEQNKSDLQEMAKQENQMRGESEELAQRFNQMNQQNPIIPPELSSKMTRAGKQMRRAETHLKTPNVQKSIEAQNRALQQLQETRDILKNIIDAGNEMSKQARRQTPRKLGSGRARDPRRGGSIRRQKEKVLLPSEDQYKVPREFREEILDAMKKHTPKSYERMVMEYYKELVK